MFQPFSQVTANIFIPQYMPHIICVACSANLYPKLKNMTFPVSPIYGYVFSNQLQVCNKQTSSLGWSKFEFRKINFVIMIFFLKMPLKSKTLITYWVPLQHRYIFSTKTWWLHNVLTAWVIFMSHVDSRTRVTSMLVTSCSGDVAGPRRLSYSLKISSLRSSDLYLML